ncbi:MAG: PBP1A family penicillin-binding protein [Actinobacteria bacterium]|nr:MAG: PBP1A family penicillin-binding protein [Actinomycetota bacterium]
MRRRGLIKALLFVTVALSVVLVLILALEGYLWYLSSHLPDVQMDSGAFQVAETSVVYAADGSVLAEWYDEQDRTVIDDDLIPGHLKAAAVAIEDRRFYEHGGIDIKAIARAFSRNAQEGAVREGGSTITQQTVKLLYTGGERTLKRKLQEAMLAISLETQADKDQVLGMYLNTVYFGRGAYGVESAAQRFFGVTSKDLTLPQCALLAGCIQSPSRFDPLVNPGPALERRNIVLREMREQGMITAEQARIASREPLGLSRDSDEQQPRFAPYFVEYVRRDLLTRLGSEKLYRGGLRIYTTLDPAAQRAAEAAAKVLPDAKTDPEVAIAAVRWRDGAVVAIVGGRDFTKEQFDLATQGKRQTGSAFKPFVLAAALENGYRLDSKWDASPFSTPVKDETWRVENYENSIRSGTYTLELATIWSINTVYARLITAVGPADVVDVAHRMGITTPIDPDPAIALGGLTTGVSPLEMASAFGTIANKGLAVPPSGIDRVTDDSGAILYAPVKSGTRAISAANAATIGGVLNQVYTKGTGSAANTGRWGAVKTGTAQSWQDAWVVGYSGDISTAVWIGFPEAQKPMTNVHGIKVTGGSYPAEVWKRFMSVATAPGATTGPTETTVVDESRETMMVYTLCPESLLIARPGCPEKMELELPAGSMVRDLCDRRH